MKFNNISFINPSKFKTWAFWAFILFNPIFSFGQECNCQIHGEVLDNITKQPIIGAVVMIKGTTKGTSTAIDGHYHFEKVCHGNLTLICKIVGYKEIEIPVKLEHDQNFEHNFRLHEDEIHLDHIEIKAQKLENLTQAKATLENRALEQSRGQNLGETLKQITGVTTLQTGSSIAKPVIHGMHSNRVLILNNGIRQEGQQWGSEHAPEIDPFVAKKITVLKGAAGVRYGSDAIAGVIMLEPEALPDTNKLAVEINTVFFTNGRQVVTSGILESGIKPKKKNYSIGLRIQGTFKRGGDISTPTYYLINTGISEINYSLSGNFKKRNYSSEIFFSQFNTKIAVFAGSHIGNVTDLIAALQRGKPQEIYTPEKFSYSIGRPYQDVQHNLLKWLNTRESELGKISLTLSKQYDFRREVDVLRGDKNLVQQFILDTYTGELLLDHKPLFQKISGSVGLTGMFQQNLTTGTLTTPKSSSVLIPNFNNFTSGIFVIERLIKAKWELEGGIRFDNRNLDVYRIPRGQQSIVNNQKNNQNLTGALGYNFRPNARWNFLVNLNSAWRAATVNELYSDGIHHGAASFEKGDESLLPEKAINISFTVNYISRKLQTEFHFYNNFINNFIFLSPTGRPVLSIRGAFPEFYYTQTNAIFQGIDLNLQYQVGKKLNYNTKVSYLKAQDKINQQPLILIPANRWENGIKYENGNSFCSINIQYVAKQKRVPTKIIFSEIPVSELIFTEYGGDYSPPPPSYMLLGATLGHKFEFSNQQTISLSLSANNILNVEYRDYLNRFRYFTDEIGRNFIFRGMYHF